MNAPLVLPLRPRVLVVDDHPMVRRACDVLLAPMADVETVATGQGALVALADGPHVDLVLLDLGLPGIDGFQVLDELLAMDASIAERIVVFSGCVHAREQRLLDALGVRWLCKPVGADVLRALVGSLRPVAAQASGTSQADAPL